MNYIRYGWAVASNLVTLFVLLALFDYTEYEPFQTIVVALLVMIYLQINTLSMMWGTQTLQTTFAMQDEIHKFEGLLKKKTKEEEEEYKEEMKNHRDGLHPKFVQRNINLGFASLFYVITIYHLVFAVI